MQEYLREYTGSSRQGLGANTASEAAQAANSTARTQHGRGHTDQRGAGAAGGTAQKETQRRSTFGSTPAAVNLISGNNNATQPGARAPGGGETVRLEEEHGSDTCMYGGNAAARAPSGAHRQQRLRSSSPHGPRRGPQHVIGGKGRSKLPVAGDSPVGPSTPPLARHMLCGTAPTCGGSHPVVGRR